MTINGNAGYGLELDFTILHYALRDKLHMLQLSKEIDVDFFDVKLQLFWTVLEKNFKDPAIREVLSLEAMLDYCDRKNLTSEHERFKIIYDKAKNLKLKGVEPASTDFKYYSAKFRRRRNLQVAQQGVQNIAESLRDKPDDTEEVNKLFKSTLHEINAVNRIQVFDEGTVGQDALNMLDEYEKIEENPAPYRGIMVGFPSWDNRCNGLQPGELTIICGMEGSGKSLLMMNWAINAWLGSNLNSDIKRCGESTFDNEHIYPDGANVLYFSLEMPRSNKGEPTQGSYLNKRIMSAVAEVPLKSMRDGVLTPDEKQRVHGAAHFMRKYEEHYHKLYVVDIPRGATVEDIESKYIEVAERIGKIDVVFIDYIGIMQGQDDSDWQAQGQIAAGLHEFARGYSVPVVTAAQLNRPKGNKGQGLDDQSYNTNRLARSAQISQNANNVLLIETREKEYGRTDMNVTIGKMRDGEKGRLEFTKRFDIMRVYDGSPIKSEDKENEVYETPLNEMPNEEV